MPNRSRLRFLLGPLALLAGSLVTSACGSSGQVPEFTVAERPFEAPQAEVTRIEAVVSGPRQGLRIEATGGPLRGRILAASPREFLVQLIDARIPLDLPVPKGPFGRLRAVVAQPPSQLRIITRVESEGFLEPDGDALRLVLRGDADQDPLARLSLDRTVLEPLLAPTEEAIEDTSSATATSASRRAQPSEAPPSPAGADSTVATQDEVPVWSPETQPPVEITDENASDLMPLYQPEIESSDLEDAGEPISATPPSVPLAPEPTVIRTDPNDVPLYDPSSPPLSAEATVIRTDPDDVPLYDPSSPATSTLQLPRTTTDAPNAAPEPSPVPLDDPPPAESEPEPASSAQAEVLDQPVDLLDPAEPESARPAAVGSPSAEDTTPRPSVEPTSLSPPPPPSSLPPVSWEPGNPIVGPPISGSPARRLVGIERGPAPLIRLRSDGELTWQLFHLDGPLRIVLDLPNVEVAFRNRELSIDSDLIRRVRVGQFRPDICRVVLDLEVPARLRVRRDGRDLVLSPIPESDAN